jgi:hypothetical protein
MKMKICLLAIILMSNIFRVNAQTDKKFFRIEKNDGKTLGKSTFYYKDKLLSDKFVAPKDNDGHPIIELLDKKFNSISKVKYIESQIFSVEELQSMKNTQAMAECLVSSSGKIICVSFIFINTVPKISEEKLAKYANRIKEEITFEFKFIREVAQEGYLYQTFPAFR